MKKIKLSVIVILAYIFQTVIIPDFNIGGVAPNLSLVLVCSIAFLFGSQTGAIVGFFSGLLMDFNQGHTIGLYAFLFMYIGLILGQSNKRFFKDNYIVAIAFTGIATFICETLIYIFGAFAYSQEFNFGDFITNVLLSVLVNIITSIIVYPLMLKVNIGVELDRNIFGR